MKQINQQTKEQYKDAALKLQKYQKYQKDYEEYMQSRK
jgi:hypothetical protein